VTSLNLDTAAAFAAELAAAVRPIVRRYFRSDLDVESKADESPVTIADRTVERTLRDLIEARFPDHGIAGEEYGVVRSDAEYVWSLDPIDGTKAFITGRPTFGTLIGLLRDGVPVLGMIDCPILDERWIGGPDLPTRLNGAPLPPARHRPLDAATLVATSPDMFKDFEVAAFARLKAAAGLTLYSGDCHNFGLLALGTLDLVVESDLQDYDYLAPAAVIAGAGGVLTDWSGNPARLGSTTRIAAARDPVLHAEALKHLAG